MFALESMIVDSFEAQEDENEDGGASHDEMRKKVASMVTLCGRMANDAGFARQVRRKHL